MTKDRKVRRAAGRPSKKKRYQASLPRVYCSCCLAFVAPGEVHICPLATTRG
jgi:hypothetical protein